MLIFYSNNVFYIFLILKKRKNEILDDKILLLLIVTKLIENVLFIRKIGNFSNFLLITYFWKKISINQKLNISATLIKGLIEINVIFDDNGSAITTKVFTTIAKVLTITTKVSITTIS